MGHLEHVHLGIDLQDLRGGVPAVVLIDVVLGLQAHVGGNQDEVGLIANLLDGLLDGLAGVLIGAIINALLAAVPAGDAGGGDADDGDLHAAGLHDSPARAGDQLAVLVRHVGAQDRELGLAQDGLHVLDAPVELVVAHGHGVIAHEVHGGDNGMGPVGGLVEDVVAHDGALDVVAGIDQDGVGVLLAHLLAVGVQAGHAAGIGFFIAGVVIAPDVAVHVGGAEDRDMGLAFCGRGFSLGGQGGGNHGKRQYQSQQNREDFS